MHVWPIIEAQLFEKHSQNVAYVQGGFVREVAGLTERDGIAIHFHLHKKMKNKLLQEACCIVWHLM